eukprot:7696071-Lingulodinium_polyedra.AAC.1
MCPRGLPPAPRAGRKLSGPPPQCKTSQASMLEPLLVAHLRAWSSLSLGGKPQSAGSVANGRKHAPGP